MASVVTFGKPIRLSPQRKQSNKLTSDFCCVCPVIDHEFRHNIVKVAVDSRGSADRRITN